MTNDFLTNKEDIIAWLDEHEVKHYTLVPHKTYGYAVNVAVGVYLAQRELTHIPVKFQHVGGDFTFYNNQITSLEFCPETVGG